MALIELAAAKSHLRLESGYPDEQVQPYLNAAELMAAQFLNRAIFADDGALATAIAAVPAALIAAGVAYDAAVVAADAIDNEIARCAAHAYACQVYTDAQTKALETRRGIVVNDLIANGILLALGHLFENRSDVEVGVSVAQMPIGSRALWQPFRVGMGV